MSLHSPSVAFRGVAESVYVGRAGEDGVRNQGWLLGHFMPVGELLHSRDVEVKWGVHPPGDRRAAWATGETRTALLVLIRGAFDIELRDRTVVLTVRWPSLPGWRLPSADI